jgi:hypothetical protein
LNGARRKALLRGDGIGEFDSLERVLVETCVDGDDLRRRIEQSEGKGAPSCGIADDEYPLGVEAFEQTFGEIDLLERDAEPVGQARAVSDEPGERREREVAEMAGIEAGRNPDASALV